MRELSVDAVEWSLLVKQCGIFATLVYQKCTFPALLRKETQVEQYEGSKLVAIHANYCFILTRRQSVPLL